MTDEMAAARQIDNNVRLSRLVTLVRSIRRRECVVRRAYMLIRFRRAHVCNCAISYVANSAQRTRQLLRRCAVLKCANHWCRHITFRKVDYSRSVIVPAAIAHVVSATETNFRHIVFINIIGHIAIQPKWNAQ